MATPQNDGSIVLTTKVVTTGIQKGMQVIKKSLKTATVAVTAFGTAVGYLVKQSVSAYAEFEQLVGGVETLFGESAEKVRKYADEAYKTAGLSANEYMKNVTAFSASLLNSLGGDTERAADVANDAIIAISDNVNKMGSDYESVQNAFQGFAKQQYMLLDNLKLGYGGTKTEMERLLKDAQAITGVEYNIDNLADVYTAIGVIQEKLGIAGTTAKEAATTISGSAATMKAAWQNVLTAISGGGDIDAAIENLVNSIEKYFENILPVVERALIGIGTVIERVAPLLVQTVANAFIKALPKLISAVGRMIIGLFQGIKLAIAQLLSGKTNEMLEKQTSAIGASANNQEKLKEEVEETNKALKGSVAGFDEIYTSTANASSDSQLEDLANSIGGSSLGGLELDGDLIVQEIDKIFVRLMDKVSDWLMVLGCILLATGNISWGVGLIIAGAIGSEYAEAQIGDGSSLKELMDTITKALTIAGIVAVVLGVLLCMAHQWGFGIKLIAIGASSLVSAVAINWNAIKEKVQGTTGGIIAIVGGALLAIGIILVASGVNLPLGIALIVAGAVALITPVALNWNAIVDWVKGAWEAVKNFWNKHIAPVFTTEFWLDLGKNALNGLIWAFESALNVITGGLRELVNSSIKLINTIGGVLGLNWDIPTIPKITLPRLAQGTVVPPNREFLAVLGDNTKEHEIVSPISSMKQAFTEAILEMGGNFGSGNGFNGTIEVPVIIDGREVARAVRSGEGGLGRQNVYGGFANVH